MHKRILAGLDGSTIQSLVLEQAVALTRSQSDAELHLCRAMMVPVSIPTVVWSLQGDDFEKFLVEHGAEELDQAAAKLPNGTVRQVHARIGQPADVLCSVAREIDADVIVIGTHGYDGLDRVIGTTAAKVVNRAPCSVLVVRGKVLD